MFKRSIFPVIAAAAIIMMASGTTPHMAAASTEGEPMRITQPKTCTYTVDNGASVRVGKGETVCVRGPVRTPGIPPAPGPIRRSDEHRLSDWLVSQSGKKLTIEEVQAFIAAEKLTIPQDLLTKLKSTLEGAGVSPGPSSTPRINEMQLWRDWYELHAWGHDNPYDCQVYIGRVGSGRNNTRYTGDVGVGVNRMVGNSASVKVGTDFATVSTEVGYNVTQEFSFSTTYTATQVPPGGSVIVYGTKIGACTSYRYTREHWGLYFNTDYWLWEIQLISNPTYRGTAFEYASMHLEAR